MQGDVRKMADESFREHVLMMSRDGWCYIKAPDSGFYATEIRLLGWHRVIVHGDIEPTIIACPYAHLRPACGWVGQSNARYIAGKVAEGERRPNAGYTLDTDQALRDLAALRDEEDCDWTERDLEAIESAEVYARNGDVMMAQRSIVEGIRDGWEIAGDLGRIVAPRIHYAQAAAARAWELLREVRHAG